MKQSNEYDENASHYKNLEKKKELKQEEKSRKGGCNTPKQTQRRKQQVKRLHGGTISKVHSKSLSQCTDMFAPYDGNDPHYPKVEVYSASNENGISVVPDEIVRNLLTTVVKIGIRKETIVQIYHVESNKKARRECFMILFSRISYSYNYFLHLESPQVWEECLEERFKLGKIRNDKEKEGEQGDQDQDQDEDEEEHDPLRDLEEMDWDINLITFETRNFVQLSKLDKLSAKHLLEKYVRNKQN